MLASKMGHLDRIWASLCSVGALLAVSLASPDASASPGADGTRNLSMGNATRGSSTGTDAAIINPAGLSYAQQFEIEPIYQLDLRTGTHGLGVFISDSLNNPRFGLGLGYTFMRGTPKIRYDDIANERQALELVHFGHEVAGILSVTAVRNWLYIGLKPKWQYVSLRYLDDEGQARDYVPKHNAFGLDAAIAVNFLDWAKFAVVVSPFVPYRDAMVPEVANVRIALEKPQQLVNDRSEMEFLGRDGREAGSEVESHLIPEDTQGADAGAVTFLDAVVEDMLHQVKVRLHETLLF